MRVGVDTGGTFTDVVTADGRIVKVLSTRDDPARAVASGVDAVGGAASIAHGTTVATNALLERRGARVAIVTNDGFADVIEIARQNRPSLYDPFADRPEPLVARSHRLEVQGRLDHTGAELVALGPVPQVPDDVEAVAVVLLHADISSAHERAVADELRARGHDVTCSHEIAPEFREYERTVTTVANAYVRPVCRSYLRRLAAVAQSVEIMTSAGGLLDVESAADAPVTLLLSGPAGGVAAGAAAAMAAGFTDAVTFDMGGTSTDVCLVLDGAPAPAAQRTVAGFPIRTASLDIHTIGAGGGSIASVDPGGALRVGPESAGADPGPACYGRGGTRATVTDADLVLGRIPSDTTFPDLGQLDRDAASRALADAGVDAAGVVAVVDAAMVQAVRAVTVERGVDPRRCALVAFGGAGPLHACAIADELDMPAVVVPPRAGVLSAVGMLTAARQVDLVRSWPTPSDVDPQRLEDALVSLAARASRAVGGGAVVDVGLDCRYAGQSHEITVPDVDDFPAEHRRRNGFDRPGAPIEVVALRATARVPSPISYDDLPPAAARAGRIDGPRVVAEADCTIWIPSGWTAVADASGAWVITRS
ncbi:MAG TPA: hydantoinase/oxoprolinase family protein [Acidimicrobiales bacterium]|nr:hydantoinase/oxoprolinase family protein [Acidimicrobiales bacterium]